MAQLSWTSSAFWSHPEIIYWAALSNAALELVSVEERAVYDGFCREWPPAYYLGKRQLFHVHEFHGGLRATMFTGVRTLQPIILDSDEVSPDIRNHVA